MVAMPQARDGGYFHSITSAENPCQERDCRVVGQADRLLEDLSSSMTHCSSKIVRFSASMSTLQCEDRVYFRSKYEYYCSSWYLQTVGSRQNPLIIWRKVANMHLQGHISTFSNFGKFWQPGRSHSAPYYFWHSTPWCKRDKTLCTLRALYCKLLKNKLILLGQCPERMRLFLSSWQFVILSECEQVEFCTRSFLI